MAAKKGGKKKQGPRGHIALVSEAGTGTKYYTDTNTRNNQAKGKGKMRLKKYDPKAVNENTGKKGAHVFFKEGKAS